MRLYSPTITLVRSPLHPVEIKGYTLAKNLLIMISPYSVQRSAQYFPEPLKFDPDRFSPEREKTIARYSYLPFGAGSRICIGNQFALMEGQLILATLAQRVNFELVAGQQIKAKPVLTLRPDPAIRVVVRSGAVSGLTV